MAFAVGETIGAYRIVATLGEGGTASVFKAYHAALDRYVALKTLYPAFKDDSTFLARFQREARVVAKLDHPNIVPIYDFSEHEGVPYLVMKFVEGETLSTNLRDGPLLVVECSRILGAVGGALAYAHQQGVLHRDLKSSDILLENDGNVYLTDFGLSRIKAGPGVTSGLVPGSPYYMSPEQGRGGVELDERSDQYSLGVVLYEMTTGHPPFTAGNAFSIIQDHLATPPQPPSRANQRITRPLDTVILRALSKNPADRFPDIKTFVETFQKSVAPPRPATAPIRIEDAATRELFLDSLKGQGGVTVMVVHQPGNVSFELKGRTEYWLGRSEPTRPFKPDLDLAAQQGMEQGVSRKHGVIRLEEGRLYYMDMKSSNGSRVNGVRLRPEIPMLLKDGDEICLGRFAFRVYFAL
jgi:serine/threonine protein kinase